MVDICLATFLGPPQLQVALEIYVQDHQTAMSTRKKVYTWTNTAS